MINERKEAQSEIEVVMLEQLVPQDHLLRKIDKYIDFSFIRDLTRDLYCHTNGRPAVDPVVLFKMLFIGYLYGIRSERQLVKDIEVNLAYRWFLGYSITEKIPDSQEKEIFRMPSVILLWKTCINSGNRPMLCWRIS